MGFPARESGALDQGTPRQYLASHAERQAALLNPNAPVEVSTSMCPDCQSFFQQLAESTGITQEVTDPLIKHIFYPWALVTPVEPEP
jgi:hypothetical protein